MEGVVRALLHRCVELRLHAVAAIHLARPGNNSLSLSRSLSLSLSHTLPQKRRIQGPRPNPSQVLHRLALESVPWPPSTLGHEDDVVVGSTCAPYALLWTAGKLVGTSLRVDGRPDVFRLHNEGALGLEVRMRAFVYTLVPLSKPIASSLAGIRRIEATRPRG